ncbi:MAG TPA: phosphoglycerate dehydrogenase, partial [Chloroflexota bacterium]|nr:phosphoglycerate dehydrogenase [Chloroflexota bacterium]
SSPTVTEVSGTILTAPGTESAPRPQHGRPRILVADTFAAEGMAILEERARVDVRKGLNEADLIAILREGGYHGMVVRSETRVTDAVLTATPTLQVVARAGVGVDTIDIPAATRHGVLVINMPTGNTITTAEHTIALLFSMTRSIPQANAALRAGTWTRQPWLGSELAGKTLGIVGLGRIGSEVAKRALTLGMEVRAYDPYLSPEVGERLHVPLDATLHDLLSQCQFLTVHTPLNDETRGMIDAAALATLPRGARVVNCARGGIIEEAALLEALNRGHIAGAAIDVWVGEPIRDPNHPLISHPKVVATPHLGSATNEAEVNVAIGTAQELLVALDGGGVGTAVNGPLLNAEAASRLAPYVTLARRLGELAVQWDAGPLRRLELRVEGELADFDCSSLTASALAAILNQVVDDRVNLVNARLIAQQRGLHVVDSRSADAVEDHRGAITLHLQRDESHMVTLQGTVSHDEPHLLMINGYRLDLHLTPGTWLCTRHNDRPGMIGEMGSLLGAANINIGFMQVGRDRPRGVALMVVGVDDPISPEILAHIAALPQVQSARVVTLR